ncbi:MAG: TetR/AcrR family transcriptional regulator [Pararhodobacter sp.]
MAGRAWRRRKSHRRDEIIAAARACLEESSGLGVPVEAIGRRAGVSEATVYNYFGTKNDLLTAVLEAWMLPAIEVLRLEVDAALSVDARLFTIARRHLLEIQRSPRLHELVYRQLRWTDYRGSALHRYNQVYSGVLRDVLETAREQGELRADIDIPVCRDLFFGGLEHLGYRTIFAGHDIDPGALARRYVRTMLDGWRLGPDARRGSPDQRLQQVLHALESLVARHGAPPGQSRAGG